MGFCYAFPAFRKGGGVSWLSLIFARFSMNAEYQHKLGMI